VARASRPPRRKPGGSGVRGNGTGQRGRGGDAAPAGKSKPKAGRPERLAQDLVGSRQHRRQLLALAARQQPVPVPASRAGIGAGAQALPMPDWLRHTLSVAGPSGTLAAFRAAAQGPGSLPFRCGDPRQEDWMHLLLTPPPEQRGISVEGARILSAQLREAVERRAQAAPAARRAPACPFDLHALLPVPDGLLRLGPDDPRVLDWLWVHWGTTWPLRHVVAQPLSTGERERLPTGHDGVRYQFWSADWTPWRALDSIRTGWPDLTLTAAVQYGETSQGALR